MDDAAGDESVEEVAHANQLTRAVLQFMLRLMEKGAVVVFESPLMSYIFFLPVILRPWLRRVSRFPQ